MIAVNDRESNTRPVSAGESSGKHLSYLDGVRALAALYVVMHHAERTVTLDNRRMTPSFRWLHIFDYGHLAVDVFIVLSGFCLMLPIIRSGMQLRGGTVGFLKRRARRILPPYFLSLALSLALIATILHDATGTPWDSCVNVSRLGLVTHALLLQDLNTRAAHEIDYPLWSVSVEWRIYFLFPLLLIAWRKLGPWTTAAAFMAAACALYAVLRNTQFLRCCPHYIGLFGLGALSAAVAFSDEDSYRSLRTRTPWGIVTGLLTLVVLMIVAVSRKDNLSLIVIDLPVGVWTCALLIYSSKGGPSRVRKFFAWKPFTLIGAFSYSLYLVHAPLLQLVWQYGASSRNPSLPSSVAWIYLFDVPLVILGAYLFSLFAERPFMKPAAMPAGTVN